MTPGIQRRPRLLLVEDSSAEAQLFVAALEEQDLAWELFVHQDGADALAFLRGIHRSEDLPDLVLLDLKIPRMGGHDVLRGIKEDRRLGCLPVVVFSGSEHIEADVMPAYRLGANAYVRKPVTFDGYLQLVDNLDAFWFRTALLPSGGGLGRPPLGVSDGDPSSETR